MELKDTTIDFYWNIVHFYWMRVLIDLSRLALVAWRYFFFIILFQCRGIDKENLFRWCSPEEASKRNDIWTGHFLRSFVLFIYFFFYLAFTTKSSCKWNRENKSREMQRVEIQMPFFSNKNWKPTIVQTNPTTKNFNWIQLMI